MATSPLDSIRYNHKAGHYSTAESDVIGYLLRVIDIMQNNVQDMALAYQDPDNDCPCVHRVQDDAGTTIVAEYNRLCPTHGGK